MTDRPSHQGDKPPKGMEGSSSSKAGPGLWEKLHREEIIYDEYTYNRLQLDLADSIWNHIGLANKDACLSVYDQASC